MSHAQLGRARVPVAEGYAKTIKSECGAAPVTCPWRTAGSPLVQDVLTIRAMARAKVPMPEISQRLSQAVGAYENAYNAANAARHEYEREQRSKSRG